VDERLKRDANAGGRESRAMQDQVRNAPAEESLVSKERRSAFQSEWLQEVLPKVPDIPGFHTCWLSSTNGWDPLHRRQRMGYTLVSAEDALPDWFKESARQMRSAEHPGAISCNEMLLYKIPLDVYNSAMMHFHHDLPMQESEKLQASYEQLKEKARVESKGMAKALIEGDGMAPERPVLRPPTFEG
jgi:hypothetical protein